MANILILEDETGVRDLLALVLRQNRYTVWEASTAEEAESVCAAHRIDGLIADIILPGGRSGTEFAASLLQSQPQVRILFMTGWLVQQSRDAKNVLSTLPEGSFTILQKPFSISTFIHEVHRLINAPKTRTA